MTKLKIRISTYRLKDDNLIGNAMVPFGREHYVIKNVLGECLRFFMLIKVI